jgi:hypothetical protein
VIEGKRPSLVKPTIHTPYYIDFSWWSQNERDWRIYLQSYLCPEHQKLYADVSLDGMVDWVDPETAEVKQVDGLQQVLISHCAKQDSFTTHHSTLVDSIFRLLLANGNLPQTPADLSQQLGREPMVILKVLSGGRVYNGLRPCFG